jgi:archaellum biogenesis protein FlaJ (TadC family)
MSLGFLVLVIWIYPNINRHSVNFSIFFCLIGVIVPAIIFGISTTLIIYAWALCIVGLLAGIVVNYYVKASQVKE